LTSNGIELSRDVEELPDSQDEGSGIGAAQGHGTGFQHSGTMQFRRQGKKRRKPNPETDDVNNPADNVNNPAPIPDPETQNAGVAHGDGGDQGPLSQHVPLPLSSSSSRVASSLPSRATEDGIRQRTTGTYFEEQYSAAGDRATSSFSTMLPSSVQRGEGSFSPETDPPPSSRGSRSLGRVGAGCPEILSERVPHRRRHLSGTEGGGSSVLVSSHQELRSARPYPVVQYPDQPSHRPFEGGSVWSTVRVRYQGVEKLLAFHVGMTLDAVNECLYSAFGLSHSRVIGLQAVVSQQRQLSNTPHGGSGKEVQSRNSPVRGGGGPSSSSLETRGDSDIASWLSRVESILEARQRRKGGGGPTDHKLHLSSPPLTMEVCRTASTVPLSDWMTACGIEKEVLLRFVVSCVVWCGVVCICIPRGLFWKFCSQLVGFHLDVDKKRSDKARQD
jgi:hypothetical protein